MRVLDNTYPIARKTYQCVLCGELIEVGEKHRACKISDGGVRTARTHTECDRVTEIDRWDDIDWESHADDMEFRLRREELREQGKLKESHQ